MARLIILFDVDVDPTREDPQEVADDLVLQPTEGYGMGYEIRQYAGCKTELVSAEWQ